MKNFLGFKPIKFVQECFNCGAYHRLSLGMHMHNSKDFTIDDHFPNAHQLQRKYLNIKMAEKAFKNFVCNELLEECNIDRTSFYLQGFEKKFVISLDIKILKKHGLLKPNSNEMSLVEGFLSYLEPFPFDSKHLSSYSSQKSYPRTIKFLRDAVEKQYLAWKYKVDVQQINDISLRLQPCLLTCRSLRNIRRNCSILDMILRPRNKSLSKKIYLINQQSFSISLVLDFYKALPSLNWDLFLCQGYKILQCPFNHIYFIIQILENKGFSRRQIQESIPFLYLSLDTFINRMNVILSHPATAQFQKNTQFLQLLHYPTVYFMNLESSNFSSLEELKIAIISIHTKMKLRKRVGQITVASIKFHVSNYFAIGSDQLSIIKRHPKYSAVTEQQLGCTLRFLKKNGFSKEDVLEAIFIILYPRRVIISALKKIDEEAKALKKIGFINGRVPEETNFFEPGTKSRRKTLQLCLYYIEKQFNFSWDGVLNINAKEFSEEEESKEAE